MFTCTVKSSYGYTSTRTATWTTVLAPGAQVQEGKKGNGFIDQTVSDLSSVYRYIAEQTPDKRISCKLVTKRHKER